MYSVAKLIKELPDNYEEKCAIQRFRGIKSTADLMMLMLIHLMNGTSLVEMSVIARAAKLGELSDVAFMNRLSQSKSWFESICQMLVAREMENYSQPQWLDSKAVVAVDATNIVEKGRSGRAYRLHYMLDVFKMASIQCKITEQAVGETLVNFEIQPNMLVIADRMYSNVRGMEHCINNGADFLLRMRKNSFKTCDDNGAVINVLSKLKEAKEGEYLDFKAFAINKAGVTLPVRICAMRKTPEQIEKTMKHLKNQERKGTVSPEAKMFNEYIVLVTSLPDIVTVEQIMSVYRLRWQVEIYFKRMKSILDFGDMPKRKTENSLSWLNGKMMVALLIESIIAKSFSPN